MSGKKVGGLARPDFKPKEKAPAPESPHVPIKEDYGSPAYQDPGLCAGTVGRVLFILLLISVVVMFLIAFGLNLGYGIKNKKAPYFCLLINIILSTLVTAMLAFWYYKGILKTSYLWYIFLQCVFLFFQLVTTDIFAVLATAPPTSAPTELPPTDPTEPIPTVSPSPNGTTVLLMAWKSSPLF